MKGKGQIDYVIMIPSVIIIAAIFIFGFQLWFEFYDFEAISGADGTTGEIGIDTETFEDIEESLEELNEEVWEGFDFDALWSAIAVPIILIISVIVAIVIISKVM